MIEDRHWGALILPVITGLCDICAFWGHHKFAERVLVISLLFVTTLTATTAAQSTRGGDAIRVAAWNITDVDEGSAQNARIMVEHLKLLQIDILALNHIDGDAERRNARLDAIFDRVNEAEGNDWTYLLFANRNLSEREDLVGVAWNRERVSLETDVFRAAIDEGDLWQKPPHGAKFTAGPGLTDIVVIPIDLDPKSPEAACLAGQRGEEAQDLARHIESARNYFSDDDIVVIGDTECVRDDRNQLEEFTAERVLDSATANVDAFASGRAGYGRVMVPADQPEFSRARHYSLLEAESQKQERPFSDHFLFLGPIEVGTDDD